MKTESRLGWEHGAPAEEIGRALMDVVELESVVRLALASLVPTHGDLAVIVFHDSSGEMRIESSDVRPGSAARLRREVGASMDPIRRVASASARHGRFARWLPTVTRASARSLTRQDERLGALLETFDVRSLIVVGLRAAGKTIGAVAVARCGSGAAYESTEFAAIQVLARRVALAIESAMLRADLQGEIEQRSAVSRAVQKWMRVFDLAWWGAAVVDGADHAFESVNPAFARLHGYADPASLAGRRFSDLLPPERAEDVHQWRFANEGKAYETEHLRLDGSRVPVLVNVTPLAGDPDGPQVVTVQDLTDLKRTEERLRRAQRMEAVGRLAGGVAHEVNNMMTIILGFSDLLTRAQPKESETRELNEIRKAALRAAKITTQLLAFSRQQVLQPVQLRLGVAVEEMLPVLRLMLPANVKVELAPPALDPAVLIDRSQLEQVLINLAFNARDAMAAGGRIRFVVESRQLNEADGMRLIGIPIPSGQYGLISVVDTGHGMDAATLEQVFDPFFTTKPMGEGTGLGLSVTQGIIATHGGTIEAHSELGHGASFFIRLPGHAPEHAAA
jgi:PAS domain S-box-containing protein